MRSSWGNWGYLACRKGGPGETLVLSAALWQEVAVMWGRSLLPGNKQLEQAAQEGGCATIPRGM